MQNLLCRDMKTMDCQTADSEVIKYMREQRHDFMNYLQVIWGYLQLEKPTNALEYIAELNKKLEVFRKIFLIESPALSLFLYKCIRRAYDLSVSVDFELEALSFEKFTIHDYREKLTIMENLFEELINKIANGDENNKIYIDVFNDEGILYITFSNNCYDDWTLSEELYKTDIKALNDILETMYKMGMKVYCKFEEGNTAVRIGLLPEEL